MCNISVCEYLNGVSNSCYDEIRHYNNVSDASGTQSIDSSARNCNLFIVTSVVPISQIQSETHTEMRRGMSIFVAKGENTTDRKK